MTFRTLAALVAILPLAACATTSFAPPAVDTRYVVRSHDGYCKARTDQTPAEIGRDVEAAHHLIDNFVLAYRCADHELANGRRYFQIPSFLAASAGLIGPALGLSNDGVLIAGSSAAGYNAGNSYFAPKAKAAIVSAALHAVLCVKTEAVGISYFKPTAPVAAAAAGAMAAASPMFTTQAALDVEEARLLALPRATMEPSQIADLQRNLIEVARDRRILNSRATSAAALDFDMATRSGVEISAAAQYYEMVSASLFSIERILAERLRDAGSTSTTEVFSKLKDLAKQSADADAKLGTQSAAQNLAGAASASQLSQAYADYVELQNDALQPKLQICTLQARI